MGVAWINIEEMGPLDVVGFGYLKMGLLGRAQQELVINPKGYLLLKPSLSGALGFRQGIEVHAQETL